MLRISRPATTAALSVLCLGVLGPVLASCASDQDAAPAVELSAEGERGKEVVAENGCTSCHSVDGEDGVGPTWAGLAGSEVLLDDGTTVVADEEYLRTAIVDPSAQIVDGYRGIMPERSFDDDDVDAMVAYLQDLGAAR